MTQFDDVENALYFGSIDVLRQALSKGFDASVLNSVLLRLAAMEGKLEWVQELLPHSNPKDIRSGALRTASSNQHQDIFDLLYDVSDPEDALECMFEDEAEDIEMLMLQTRMRVDEEHLLLNECMTSKPTTNAKKKI